MGLEELWDIVARWAKETFSFVSGENTEVSEPSPTYDGEYTSLQDLLKKSNRPYDMVPTWIPDGFVLEKVEKDITPVQEVYRALYQRDEKELIIRIQNHILTDIGIAEIEDDPTDFFTISGVEYYIFENVSQLQIMWMDNQYECIISGDISLDEAKLMVTSITKED